MIEFGTGGWRAIIGDEFTRINIQKVAKAMAMKMKAENVSDKGIVIGYDRRFLAKEAVMWICEVMASEGIHSDFVNRSVPTPLIMFYTMKHSLPYGMMVTASHNPALYNGIKVFTGGGCDADETQTDDIERYINLIDGEIVYMDYKQALQLGFVTEMYPMNEYIDSIIENINMSAIKAAGLRVALDPMYGVSKNALSTILFSARCELEVINAQHDTLFGGKLPSPSAETLKSLQNYVIDNRCDIGIATDGDADRLGVIDDTGRFLPPNDILALLYYYLLKYKGWKGPAVRNIATTHRLDRIAESFQEQCYEVPVGFKHVSGKMRETGAIIGGESSGGLTVHGHIQGKDGIYAASLLLEMIAVTGKKLSVLITEMGEKFGTTYMSEKDCTFDHATKDRLQHLLFAEKKFPDFGQYAVEKVSYLDGCKVYFKNGGWIIVRFSGTEPLLRIFCEMENKATAEAVGNLFLQFLKL